MTDPHHINADPVSDSIQFNAVAVSASEQVLVSFSEQGLNRILSGTGT